MTFNAAFRRLYNKTKKLAETDSSYFHQVKKCFLCLSFEVNQKSVSGKKFQIETIFKKFGELKARNYVLVTSLHKKRMYDEHLVYSK